MSLNQLVEKINKEYGKTIVSGVIPPKERIPFSSPYLNHATYGGICYGASSEFVGQESSGKSTLAQDLIHNFQKIEKQRYEDRKKAIEERIPKAKGKELDRLNEEINNLKERVAIYLDLEQTIDGLWLKKLGVDADKVLLVQPSAMGVETPLDWIIEACATGEVGFVIVDSIGAMLSDAEENKTLSEFTYGGISKALTRFYKKVMPHVKQKNVALLVINQTRDDMNNPYNKFNRPGGNMNKFAQSLSLGLAGGQKYDDRYADATGKSEMVYARETNVQVIKNKTAPPDRQRSSFTIKFGHGIDKAYDTFCMACDEALVIATGAYYTFSDPITGEAVIKIQGKANAINHLRKNKDLLDAYWKILYDRSVVSDFVEEIEEEIEEVEND